MCGQEHINHWFGGSVSVGGNIIPENFRKK